MVSQRYTVDVFVEVLECARTTPLTADPNAASGFIGAIEPELCALRALKFVTLDVVNPGTDEENPNAAFDAVVRAVTGKWSTQFVVNSRPDPNQPAVWIPKGPQAFLYSLRASDGSELRILAKNRNDQVAVLRPLVALWR